MHPILRVTHCTKCHDFYNSGEFSKGEDGSELYCRWCGQGGEVYCCSNCPFVFCKSCIIKNLSRGVVADIEQNENWSCFNCAPKILWPLRAQHWALKNYIGKQKKVILASNLSDKEIQIQMNKDRSSCCRLKPKTEIDDTSENIGEKRFRKLSSKPTDNDSPIVKKSRSNDEVVCTPDLLSMLMPDCELTVTSKNKSTTATNSKTMSNQQSTTGYNVNSNQQQQQAASPGCETTKITASPPPLVIRNSNVTIRPALPSPVMRKTIIGPRTSTPITSTTPVYHTINGFRIDLNSAAQQETFRLPNGKLIQVKRQGTNLQSNTQSSSQHNSSQSQSQSPASSSPINNPWSRSGSPMQNRGMQINHGPSNTATAAAATAISNLSSHFSSHHIPMPTIGSTTVRYVNQSQIPQNIHNGSMHFQTNGGPTTNGNNSIISSLPTQQSSSLNTNNIPTMVQGSTATIRPVMLRHIFPDTPIGNARTQLQNQIFNAMEICQHLIGKFQTLTNSNAYKLARNQIDIKELYIHLSYLLTYANGRFKGLQDKCLDDMRQLGFIHDADSLENGQLAAEKQASDDEDNEIEIVEPKTDTITLDSDNEEDESSKENLEKEKHQQQPQEKSQIPVIPTTSAVITSSHDQFSVSSSSITVSYNQTTLNSTVTSSSIVNSTPISSSTIQTVTVNNPSETNEFFTVSNMLSGVLDTELTESDQTLLIPQTAINNVTIPVTGNDSKFKKQPRKKTTNKPNPTLIKQKEILERERLEEMKRNDVKLKRKCIISLQKAEDIFPYAKQLVQQARKTNNENKIEIISIEELDNCFEETSSLSNNETDNCLSLEKNKCEENLIKNHSKDTETVKIDLIEEFDNTLKDNGKKTIKRSETESHVIENNKFEKNSLSNKNHKTENDEIETILVDEIENSIEENGNKVPMIDKSTTAQQKIKNSEIKSNEDDKNLTNCDIEISNNLNAKKVYSRKEPKSEKNSVEYQTSSTVRLENDFDYHQKTLENHFNKENPCSSPRLLNDEPEVDVDQEIDKLLRLRKNNYINNSTTTINIQNERKTNTTSPPELSDDITELVLGEASTIL